MGVIMMYSLLFLLTITLVDQVMMMDHGSSWCKQCKQVEGDGPLAGHYYLQSDHDPRCEDLCSYSKGDDLYCFIPGQEVVNPCDDQGSGMVDKTTMEMKPGTVLRAMGSTLMLLFTRPGLSPTLGHFTCPLLELYLI